jgi:nucleotide-binding universal stress UspA family protein
MFTLGRIVLPVDFSERSAGAARYVHPLATRFASEVTLLHVLPPPHYEFSALEVGGTVLNELFASRLAQVGRELDEYLVEELAGVNVKRLLLEGDPARKIVEYVSSANADIIVMPTHGYGSFRRFILGSVTAKVLHDADCPVWTGVHLEGASAAVFSEMRKVVCAVDLGPQSAKTLRWAAGMAQASGAELVLVHAIPAIERGGEALEGDCGKQLRAEVETQLRALLDETGVQASVTLTAGDPPKAVCDAVAAAHAGLLVIGRGSAAGVFGRLRANAYALIRQSPCPVVSV